MYFFHVYCQNVLFGVKFSLDIKGIDLYYWDYNWD